jgi:protein phosphatase
VSGETKILLPSVEVAHRTDPGRDPQKQVNEDALGYRETRFGHLCVVCDGMGGHTGGREASSTALATIFEAFDTASLTAKADDVLRDAITLANVRVRSLVIEDETGGRPGSTVVTVLLHAGGTEVAHVGDSRAFLVHQGQIFQLTRDHSMVQEMVDARILTPAQAAVHPDANKITRALGIDDAVEVDVRPQPVAHVAGDMFVLCSDGLTDLVEMPEILQMVTSDPPAQAAGKLVDLANARGGHDNISVLILRARMSAAGGKPFVAETVAQTMPETLPHTVTEPPPPPGPAHIPSAPSPPPVSEERGPRRAPPAMFVGALLALVGIAVAIVALYTHLDERRGKSKHVNVALSGPLPVPPPASSTVVALSAQPLEVVPLPDASTEDVDAGLAPLVVPSVRHSHKVNREEHR